MSKRHFASRKNFLIGFFIESFKGFDDFENCFTDNNYKIFGKGSMFRKNFLLGFLFCISDLQL